MLDIVNIFIKGGKAYLPSFAQIEEGLYKIMEPVYSVDLETDQIVEVLNKLNAKGHPKIKFIGKPAVDPLLSAVGVKSYKKLYKELQAYVIDWGENSIKVLLPTLDKKGLWTIDYEKAKTFDKSVSFKTIVDFILQNYRSTISP